MKKLMIALMICFGLQAFASDPSIFRDEETGFLMVVPGEMHESWSFNLYDVNLKLNAFLSTPECKCEEALQEEVSFDLDDECEEIGIEQSTEECSDEECDSDCEEMHFLVVGRVPTCICDNNSDLYVQIIEAMGENFPLGSEGVYWSGESRPTLAENANERIYLQITSEEDECEMGCDVHFYNRDNFLTFVITGVIGEGSEEQEAFTQGIVENVCFVQK